jgi:hypothetical protein
MEQVFPMEKKNSPLSVGESAPDFALKDQESSDGRSFPKQASSSR